MSVVLCVIANTQCMLTVGLIFRQYFKVSAGRIRRLFVIYHQKSHILQVPDFRMKDLQLLFVLCQYKLNPFGVWTISEKNND